MSYQKNSKVLAVDFDGVLCEDKYPKIGYPHVSMINYFIERKNNGDKLILWTCRKGIYLNNAVAWCKKRGLIFDAVNENLPECIEKYGGDTRKIFADIYFDDKNSENFEPREIFCNDWAIEEIEKLEKEIKKNDLYHDNEGQNFDYIHGCCDSALRAYRSLYIDDHSGCSMSITKDILNKLIDHQPLTVITDESDEWCPIGPHNEYSTYISAQNRRMPSLFKNIYRDGKIIFSDNNRYIAVDVDTGATYGSGLIRDLIDTVYPITMPYMPDKNKYKVFTEDFLVNKRNGDFDTIGILYLIKPNGERFTVGHYFKETKKGWKRISKFEYIVRKFRKIKK